MSATTCDVMARDVLLHAIDHLAMRGCDNDTLDAISILLYASREVMR